MAKIYDSHKIYPGLLIYRYKRSPYWRARMRIGGGYTTRSTKEKVKNMAIKEAVAIHESLMDDPESSVSGKQNTFAYWADRLVQKEKLDPPAPSGNLKWKDTEKILKREKGLLAFFRHDDIKSINMSRIEEFLAQLTLKGKSPSKWTQRKHLIVLNKVLTLGGVDRKMPKLNARESDRQPRGFFSLQDYRIVRDASKEHAGKLKFKTHNGTEYRLSLDLHAFIIFMLGSMLRPTRNEIFSLKHGDVRILHDEVQTDYEYLEFIVNRKNKKMKVQTLQTCVYALKSIRERRPDYQPDDYIFLPEYPNRQTAVTMMGIMFRNLLRHIDMTADEFGNKYTLYSLRHSAIVFNLNQPNVDRSDIAKRADTSFEMIDKFYYPQVPQPDKLRQYQRITLDAES